MTWADTLDLNFVLTKSSQNERIIKGESESKGKENSHGYPK
jgi:hypothetical protein